MRGLGFVVTVGLVACGGSTEEAPSVEAPEKSSEPLEVPAAEREALECSHLVLSKMEREGLRFRRNEVFARHGRVFSAVDLQQYFYAKAWYKPTEDYTDARLSGADKACVERARLWENAKGTLYAASEDLDGDGTAEPIYVLASDERLVNGSGSVCDPVCKAVLVVGDLTLPIELNWEQSAYWSSIRDSAAFAVVDVDTADSKKEILIRTHYRQEEDPGILNRFVSLIDGRLVTAEIGSESYSGGGVTWTGDGQVNLRVSFCPEEEATFQLRSGALKEIHRESKPLPLAGCPACPYVDVIKEDQWVRQGEILRHQVGASENRWQRLLLENSGQQTMHVRISEEKEEVTHLDAVRLLAGDAVILPSACTGSSGQPSYCQADGAYMLLEEGDKLDLAFTVPMGSRELYLEAHGYYEYLPVFAER